MKRVLITGAKSYIGESFERWARERHGGEFEIETQDMLDGSWRQRSFTGYDVVFHVAGIVHRKERPEMKELYEQVNTALPVEVAQKAKREKVKQFIFMSSMSVYGMDTGTIDRNTVPKPKTWYGKSKLKAEKELKKIEDLEFGVAIVRPPMVYGKGCKGNYAALEKIAKKAPLFPDIKNERSMLYIEDLCEFLCLLMEDGGRKTYFPQNREYVRTSDMVRVIAKGAGHPMLVSKLWNPLVWVGKRIPGKIRVLTNKVFGSLVYEQEMSRDFDGNYQRNRLETSIRGRN